MKRFYVFFFLGLLLCMQAINSNTAQGVTTDLTPNAKSAVLIEATTGEVIFKKNEHAKLPPASMTKIMSMILVCEKIRSGDFTYDQMITTSAYANSMDGSRAFLDIGEQLSVDEMLKCILIASANDAMVAMAEAVAGTEAEFVALMNAKAKELGCENTNFSDSTGLSNSSHYTSSYDMAIMSRHLINNFGDIVLKYTVVYDDYIRKDTPRKFWLVNTNKLVKSIAGLDGLKTGWTQEAGYCLSATMVKGGLRLISVIMGEATPLIRNSETVSLLNYGFSNYERRVLLPKGEVIVKLNDIRYKPNKFTLVLLEDVAIITKKGTKAEEVRYEITKEAKTSSNEKGLIKVYYGAECLGEFEYGLEAPIQRKNFGEILLDILKELFT